MENNYKNNKYSSPPKHRHDGASPLPLGIDWSPPPKKWDGRYTVWPHDPRTGWSYCVIVPSWIVQPELGASRDGSLDAIVFFRVLVGIQSPEGVTTSHVILRRFSDFLELYSAVKRAFQKKKSRALSKNSLSKANSLQILLEERRRTLEQWIGSLLSDIDISRSALVANFLELESAVRSSYNINQQILEASIPHDEIANTASLLNEPILGALADITMSSTLLSTPSEFRSISGTLSQQDPHISESNVMKKSVHSVIALEKSEELVTSELQHKKENLSSEKNDDCGNSWKKSLISDDHIKFTAKQKPKWFCHSRNLSMESTTSGTSYNKGSELTNRCRSNSLGDGFVDILYSDEAPMEAFGSMEMHCVNGLFVMHPVDQRHKLSKFFANMHQRLAALKTDMVALIAQLDEVLAVKEYLMAKLKDLEVELESTNQKSKEDLQQAILQERERHTQIQWDMDELLRNYKSMESKLKSEQNEKLRAESDCTCFFGENELLLQELTNKTEQLKHLRKRQEELEIKSKSDIRVLVKEVKYLRRSQAEVKEALDQSLKEKIELERLLEEEKQRRRHFKLARKKLIYASEDLLHRLQESSVNFLAEGEDRFTVCPSSLSDALGLLATSDTRIGLLLAKAQFLHHDNEHGANGVDGIKSSVFELADDSRMVSDDEMVSNDEIRKLLSDTIVDTAILRKHINSVLRCALKTMIKPPKDHGTQAPPRKTALARFLRR